MMENKYQLAEEVFGKDVTDKIVGRLEEIELDWVNKDGNQLSKLQGEKIALDFVLGLPEQIKAQKKHPSQDEDKEDVELMHG